MLILLVFIPIVVLCENTTKILLNDIETLYFYKNLLTKSKKKKKINITN